MDPRTAATRVADTVLTPNAEQVDRTGVIPSSHFTALADAGLFGLAAPTPSGGSAMDAGEVRRVIAAIGGACGATFFVWVQHHGVVRAVATTANDTVAARLGDLCDGRLIAGTAFAHVRRSGTPAISASRVDGGWRLDGTAPWATSWGIASMFSVAAVTADGRLVWVLLDVDPACGPDGGVAGLRASPLDLPVFGATGTVALDVDGVIVSDEQVLAVERLVEWQFADRRRAALGQPATLGITDRVVRHLDVFGEAVSDDAVADAASRLRSELGRRWDDDDRLRAALDGPDADGAIASASEHRAACLDLARRSTTAFLAAVGGRGMDRAHPAQRLAREADFYVIQAQTVDGRRATLRSV